MICPQCGKEYSKFNIKQHIQRHVDPEYGLIDKELRRLNGKKSIKRLTQYNKQFSNYEERYGIERAEQIKSKISSTAKISQNNLDKNILAQKKDKLRKHAIANNYGGYKPGSGRGKSGWYKEIWCDSSWELAFVMYCLDHNINIIRNTKRFKYSWKGKSKNYIPDFIIDGELVEIKGFWSDEFATKKQQCDKFIFVIDSTNITHYIQYAKMNYGKNFIKLYETGK